MVTDGAACIIKKNLGWAPFIDWDERFEQTIHRYVNNEARWRPLVGKGSFEVRRGVKSGKLQ